MFELSTVLFSEPQRTQFDLEFPLLGVPVRVSPWFWLGAVVMGYNGSGGDPKLLFLWIVAVFFSVTLHEMGHALVIRRFGDYPHIVLTVMGGLAIGGRARTSTQQILISAAGPGIQLLFAALIISVVHAMGYAIWYQIPFWNSAWFDFTAGEPLPYENLDRFLYFLIVINIVWPVINLVPVYPLDGGQIARAALVRYSYPDGFRQSLWLSVIAGGIAALYGFSREQPFLGILFASLAYDSFQALQTGGRQRPW